MKKSIHFLFAVTLSALSISLNAYAASNTFSGETKLSISGSTECTTSYSIVNSSEANWALETSKENDAKKDGFVDLTLTSHAELGDKINAKISSDTKGTYLGITIMPRVNGRWEPGVSTAFLAGDEERYEASLDYTIGKDVSEVKVVLCNHTSMFESKKPGCVDVVMNIAVGDNEIAEPVAKKETGLLSNPISLAFIIIMILLITYSVSKKVSAHRNKR